MMPLLGREIMVLRANDPSLVGLKGIVELESMKMLTVVSGTRKRSLPKLGTVLQLEDSKKLIVADDMVGRLEDRLARGSKL